MTSQPSLWTIAVIALLLTGCGNRETEPPAGPPVTEAKRGASGTRVIQPPPAVQARLQTEAVAQHVVPDAVSAPGEVSLDLRQVAKITSRIAGQAEKVHAQLGDHIKQGQPLVAIGGLQLDQLIEEYLVWKAQADVADNTFRRTQKLRADDIVPERKLIEDKGRYLETQARYQHIREKLLNMGLSTAELTALERGHQDESHRYTLTAPIAGTLVAQNVVRGQGVAPGDELFEIVDTSRVWVFANLPIEQARKFKEGDTGTITPKGGEPVTAALTYLAPVADETTRTIRVRFEVTNVRGALKPGEYVDVTLSVPESPTLAVPVAALTTIDNQPGVFVRRAQGYTFAPIESGREGGGWIEVRKGLSDQDTIVTEGVFDLKNVLLNELIGSGE